MDDIKNQNNDQIDGVTDLDSRDDPSSSQQSNSVTNVAANDYQSNSAVTTEPADEIKPIYSNGAAPASSDRLAAVSTTQTDPAAELNPQNEILAASQQQPAPTFQTPTDTPLVGGIPVASGQSPLGKAKGKKIGTILAAIFGFIIFTGIIAAFFVVNYLNNQPDKVLADAIANTATDLLDRKPTNTISKFTFSSKPDNTSIVVDLNTIQKDKDGKLIAKAVMKNANFALSVDAEVIYIANQEVYIKITNLRQTVDTVVAQMARNLGLTIKNMKTTLDPLITKVDGNYIKITTQDLSSPSGTIGNIEVNKCGAAVDSLRISEDDKSQMKKLFKENQFFTASEVLSKSSAAGEKSFHYVIRVSEEPAVNFARGVANLKSFENVIKDCDINKNDIKKSDGSGSGPDEDKLELWVGTKSRRFTKVKYTGKDTNMSVELTSELKFENKPSNIAKPAQFITIKELQADIEKMMAESGI